MTDLNALFAETTKKSAVAEEPNGIFDRPVIEDIKPKPKLEKKVKEQKEDPERLARTVFVGNVPKSVREKSTLKEFKDLFKEFGKVESIRFRSIPFDKPAKGQVRKASFVKGELHPERDSFNAYVVMAEKKNMEQIVEQLNGKVFSDKHLLVDYAEVNDEVRKKNMKKTVFVGNLDYGVTEEEFWRLFEQCGTIKNVRLIRDKFTNIGKGFGYVLFDDRAAATLALKLDGSACNKRKIRVTKCVDSEKKKASDKLLDKKATDKKDVNRKAFLRRTGQTEEDVKPQEKQKKKDAVKSKKDSSKPKKDPSKSKSKKEARDQNANAVKPQKDKSQSKQKSSPEVVSKKAAAKNDEQASIVKAVEKMIKNEKNLKRKVENAPSSEKPVKKSKKQ